MELGCNSAVSHVSVKADKYTPYGSRVIVFAVQIIDDLCKYFNAFTVVFGQPLIQLLLTALKNNSRQVEENREFQVFYTF